jgi:hypothetical protein
MEVVIVDQGFIKQLDDSYHIKIHQLLEISAQSNGLK